MKNDHGLYKEMIYLRFDNVFLILFLCWGKEVRRANEGTGLGSLGCFHVFDLGAGEWHYL